MTGISHGMVLAAGLGRRMRPLTDDRPKALVELRGEALMDRALAQLRRAGVTHLVVNAHYRSEQIHTHLSGAPDVVISDEADLLETGGGVAKALPHLGTRPFFVVNSDAVWTDGAEPALVRLANMWRDDEMDALLLMHPVVEAVGYTGAGDFDIEPSGRAVRRAAEATAAYVFTGVQLLHPRLFDDVGTGAFSLNVLYDRAAGSGRLYGLAHRGWWFHVGTPEELALAEQMIVDSPGPGTGSR